MIRDDITYQRDSLFGCGRVDELARRSTSEPDAERWLLLQGWLVTRGVMRPLAELLVSEGVEVCAPIRGLCGGRVDRLADSLAANPRVAGRPFDCVLGHSYGGIIARKLVGDLYTTLGSAVLVSVFSPHRGVPAARLVPPIGALHTIREPLPDANVECRWTINVRNRGDRLVPEDSQRWEAADDELRLETHSHFAVLRDEAFLSSVLGRVRRVTR